MKFSPAWVVPTQTLTLKKKHWIQSLNIGLKGIDVNQTYKFGYNALHWASDIGDKEIVQFVYQKKIFFNKNALDFAYENGHQEIIEILIEKGLELSVANSTKNSPLMMVDRNCDIYGKTFYFLVSSYF